MTQSQASSTQSPTAAGGHLGPVVDESGRHQRFEAGELAIVLSHYDLGVIERIQHFRRGSRRAPKLRITTRRGEYLLKRRAAGRDDPFRVAFTHGLQLHLAQRGFPVARLIGTRGQNNSMLQHGGRTYELFEYVTGRRYDRSSAEAEQSGVTLGELHRLLTDHRSKYEAPAGTFHGLSEIDARLAKIPETVAAVDPECDQKALADTCAFLGAAYREASERAGAAGYRQWPPCILHGDWHPGNLIYRDKVVISVLDFDSARMEPRMADVANAALQFSMKMTKPDAPESWPERLDVRRIRALLKGYDLAASKPVSADERQTLPWLIIEALILESVLPIAATGRFARLSGSSFLKMVERKVRCLQVDGTREATCCGCTARWSDRGTRRCL